MTDRLGAKLGEGQFGIVYQGTYFHEEENRVFKVAVKTVRQEAPDITMRSLLNELKVMAYLGSHANIVCLIGCCFQEVKKGAHSISTEVSEVRSKVQSLSYLVNCRTYFQVCFMEFWNTVNTGI